MKIEKLIKVVLFKYVLPEYAFMPWNITTAVVKGKCRIVYRNPLWSPARGDRAIYFFKTNLDGIYDEPEISYSMWKNLKRGDVVSIRYRKSRIHADIPGGREVQSIVIKKEARRHD